MQLLWCLGALHYHIDLSRSGGPCTRRHRIHLVHNSVVAHLHAGCPLHVRCPFDRNRAICSRTLVSWRIYPFLDLESFLWNLCNNRCCEQLTLQLLQQRTYQPWCLWGCFILLRSCLFGLWSLCVLLLPKLALFHDGRWSEAHSDNNNKHYNDSFKIL
ncbi:hypothetical protein D918_03920, partial [Trichuris suis]